MVALSPLKVHAANNHNDDAKTRGAGRRQRVPLGSSAACFALLWGCASVAPPPAPPPVAAAPTRVETVKLEDRGWGVLRSKSLGLKLALPEARSWLAASPTSPAGAPWQLRHEPTGSTLSVRRWRASRLPKVEACDAELRARTPELASIDETNLVAQHEVRAPQGFVTRISLVALPGQGTRVSGQAIAVGAGVGECLAAVIRTESVTEEELAERLRLFDVALGHLRMSHVEDRVPNPQPPEP